MVTPESPSQLLERAEELWKDGRGREAFVALVECVRSLIPSKSQKWPRPSLEEVRLFCVKAGIPESDADWFFYKCEGNDWTNGGKPIKKWGMTLTSWKCAGYLPSQKGIDGKPLTPKTPTHVDRGIGQMFADDPEGWAEYKRGKQ